MWPRSKNIHAPSLWRIVRSHSAVSSSPVLGERASIIKTFTEKDMKVLAELTGDNNPIHLDPQFVRRTGIFHKPIVNATLVNGLVSALIGTKLPGPGSVIVMKMARYPAPLYVGDTVRAEVVVTSIKKRFVDLSVECINMSVEEERKVMLGKITVMMARKDS